MDKRTDSPVTFELQYLRIGDLEKVLDDLRQDRSRTFRLRNKILTEGMTWAKSPSHDCYLLKLPPLEVEHATDSYLLVWQGRVFETCRQGITPWKLVLAGEVNVDDASRVKQMFGEALAIFGKYGKGQDGKFNATKVNPYEGTHWTSGEFDDDT